MLVGFAWQKGWLPLSAEAILRAIEINGVAVAFNREAFLWGRRAAHDPAAVEAIAARGEPARAVPRTLDEIVTHRAALLEAYPGRCLWQLPRRRRPDPGGGGAGRARQ
ncbi:MAG: hypothetical protein R3C69_12200 [Geminicoccaceae bacterium]